jgi:two-component system OmpR family response regulator
MVGLRIAVCDDSTMDRYIIQRIFTLQGLTEIEYFENEDDLLNSDSCFDIYLIDLVLRSMSGRNVVYALRQRYPDSVIIAVSGIDSVKTISSVLSAGADDYITKPFNSDLFMARLSTRMPAHTCCASS